MSEINNKNNLSIYASFNAELLSRYISNSSLNNNLKVKNFSLQDISTALMSTKHEEDSSNKAFIWALPTCVSPSFSNIINFKEIPHERS